MVQVIKLFSTKVTVMLKELFLFGKHLVFSIQVVLLQEILTTGKILKIIL